MKKIVGKVVRWILFFPVSIRYGEIPEPKAGYFRGCLFFMLIGIDPDHKEDKGLHEHEMTHARQHVYTLFFHPLFYRFSKKYRLNAELEAYCVQLACYPEEQQSGLIWKFGGFIADWYGLDVKQDEAAALLSEMYYIGRK